MALKRRQIALLWRSAVLALVAASLGRSSGASASAATVVASLGRSECPAMTTSGSVRRALLILQGFEERSVVRSVGVSAGFEPRQGLVVPSAPSFYPFR